MLYNGSSVVSDRNITTGMHKETFHMFSVVVLPLSRPPSPTTLQSWMYRKLYTTMSYNINMPL